MTKNNSLSFYLFKICFAAAMGGFLFGFDTAVASGTIGFLKQQFLLNSVQEGWVMSSALLGSIFGAAIAGILSDKFGRKKILVISAVLFFVSALGSTMPNSVVTLIVARTIGGIGVGIAAMVAPLFISELSPPHLRGRLVALYQFAITLGILVSFISNSYLLQYSVESHSAAKTFLKFIFVDEVWRGMFGMEVLPSLFFMLMLIVVPESPRWLIKVGRDTEAKGILDRILESNESNKEYKEIKETVYLKKGKISELFSIGLRTALLIGLLIPIFQQLSGITAVMYYAPGIFEKAGFESSSAFSSSIVIGFVNMIFTVFAIWKIDKWGRRPILIAGYISLAMILILIGWNFEGSYDTGKSGMLILFVLYIISFAITLGPGTWVVLSEIYPNDIRGRAMSISTLIVFAGSALITQTFPWLRDNLGIGITFSLYGIAMIPAAIFTYKILPETKGKTLEDIEKGWSKNNLRK